MGPLFENLAGEQGLEPRLPDPESGVLPLHHSPIVFNEVEFYQEPPKCQVLRGFKIHSAAGIVLENRSVDMGLLYSLGYNGVHYY